MGRALSCRYRRWVLSSRFGQRLHGEWIAQRQFGDFAEFLQLHGMIGMAHQNLLLIANDENSCFAGWQIFRCDVFYVLKGYFFDSTPIVLPELRVFGVPACKLIVRKCVGCLCFGREGARKSIDERSLRSVELLLGSLAFAHLIDFLEDDRDGI